MKPIYIFLCILFQNVHLCDNERMLQIVSAVLELNIHEQNQKNAPDVSNSETYKKG